MSWLTAHANLLQWPAMLVTLLGAWFVSSTSERRRHVGFWLYVASNVLWVGWGLIAEAYALIVLQFGLALLNVRGMKKTEK